MDQQRFKKGTPHFKFSKLGEAKEPIKKLQEERCRGEAGERGHFAAAMGGDKFCEERTSSFQLSQRGQTK